MRLTEKNIHHYLLDKGYLNVQLFMEGDYTLEHHRSRNSIFRVYQEAGTPLFVKQLVDINTENAYLMQKDATAHHLIHHCDVYLKARKFIPNFIGYDPSNQVLVTELFPTAKNLYEVILEHQTFSTSYAKKIAEILHSFHHPIQEELNHNSSLQFFNQQLPWIINVGEPQFMARHETNPVIKTILEHQDLVHNLDRLRLEWKITSLIHGDVKWVNFVLVGQEEKKEEALKLIDWEIANVGDPLWDVAGVFQSYLSSWVYSYNNGSLQHHKFSGQEYISIPSIQSGIQAFWKNYAQLKAYSDQEEQLALNQVTRMTAARLLQTAFESNVQHPQLLPNTARIIQLCQHLFNQPEQIISDLFGLNSTSYEKAAK
ncbi:phosphotransferase family protein [Aureispira anguillae]|uniref:Aminoglycoside phosphotransferase domain-containing protein n=1 Tax=Aureispira anguillae TaxID=2864201 RepID=A0A915YAY9_9BACT|nr:hypothetical protein [Aureispira anguillae]BDS09690.1 hypothetical protein AsAng_0003940 [Aureispira anguillae]